MFFGIPFFLLQTLINLSESHIPGLLLSFYEVTRSFDYSNFDFRNTLATSEHSIVVKIHESAFDAISTMQSNGCFLSITC